MKEKIVEVIWLDAAGEGKKDKDEITSARPQDLLVKTRTFGILSNEDEKAITILQETSEHTVDYTVIPRGMIVKINKLTHTH